MPRAAKIDKRRSGEGGNVCGARCRNGKMCTHLAGMGTDHFGSGRCYKHDIRESGMGDARILTIVARDPALAVRAQVYLSSNRELLNARRELSVLKARFETMNIDHEHDTDVPRLCQLANTISLMTRRIQDIEIARKHYVHIDVVTRLTTAYSLVGQQFFPDEVVREQFIDAVEAHIKDTISRANARGVASRLMTKDAENAIVDVKDYEVKDCEVKEDEEDDAHRASP